MRTRNIPLFLHKIEKTYLHFPHLVPDLELWLTLSGPNCLYLHVEQIFMAPKIYSSNCSYTVYSLHIFCKCSTAQASGQYLVLVWQPYIYVWKNKTKKKKKKKKKKQYTRWFSTFIFKSTIKKVQSCISCRSAWIINFTQCWHQFLRTLLDQCLLMRYCNNWRCYNNARYRWTQM